jgi:hypothetical protein
MHHSSDIIGTLLSQRDILSLILRGRAEMDRAIIEDKWDMEITQGDGNDWGCGLLL